MLINDSFPYTDSYASCNPSQNSSKVSNIDKLILKFALEVTEPKLAQTIIEKED